MGAGSTAAHETIWFWNFTSSLEHVHKFRLDFYVRIHLRGTHPTLRFKKKRGLRFVRVFCISFCLHVRCFRRFSFAFTFICLGSALVFCFRQGCFEKGKTKLGSVADQLYCPFRTTQGVVGGILLPLWFPFAPWVFVSPSFATTRSLLASPRGFVLSSCVYAFTRTQLHYLTPNIAKHNFETQLFPDHFSSKLKVCFVQFEFRIGFVFQFGSV